MYQHHEPVKDDYVLARKQETDKKTWLGVRNVVDKKSCDPWARITGWYVASIDGKDLSFPLLSDALRAYDSHVVGKFGAKTKDTHLNLPGERQTL